MLSNRLDLSWTSEEGKAIIRQVNIEATAADVVSVAMAAGEGETQVYLHAPLADVQLFYMVSTVDTTVKTNSSSAPQETLSLKAGRPMVWYHGCGFELSHLFAGDVTGLFVSTGGEPGLFELRLLKG